MLLRPFSCMVVVKINLVLLNLDKKNIVGPDVLASSADQIYTGVHAVFVPA